MGGGGRGMPIVGIAGVMGLPFDVSFCLYVSRAASAAAETVIFGCLLTSEEAAPPPDGPLYSNPPPIFLCMSLYFTLYALRCRVEL